MVLYVDETECEEFFIVTGLLVENASDINDAYKRFKKNIKGFSIPEKYKSKLFTEFKSTLLDRDYSRVKRKMLEEICALDGVIIYSSYIKKTPIINQIQKESLYITLLSSIMGTLDRETTIVFDRFGKQAFENNIVDSASTTKTVVDIYPQDSQQEPGLQFVDNICSVCKYMYKFL